MVKTQYAVTFDCHGDLYFLENSHYAKFVSWFPVNNLYATIEAAWWDLYAAIERGMDSGLQFVGDRAKDVTVLRYDPGIPEYFIGSYKFVPVSLEMNLNAGIGANDHLQELQEQ